MQRSFLNIIPADISWHVEKYSSSLLSCPICKVLDNHQLQLSIPSLADGSIRNLFRCKACDSRFFDPPEIQAFSEITGDSKKFHKHYCEVGAGIWEMFWPVAMIPVSMATNLLDVGCGFGYTVDCWRTIRGEAIGLELAEYGRLGANLLDIPIYFDYLEDIAALKDIKFDVVYASEVIEHVADCQSFILELSAHVKPKGFLVLTTPNADFIKVENESPTLIAALSPGFHGFLFSAATLEKTLRDAGFSHVIVREYNERLVAWSSKEEFNLLESFTEPRRDYLNYLSSAIEKLANRHDLVYDGFLYRLFRDQLNAGNIQAAAAALQKLEASLKDKYGPTVLQPKAILESLSLWATNSQFAELYPYFLPNYLFYRGIFGLKTQQDLMHIVQYFSASWIFTKVAVERIGTHSFLEATSLIWLGRLQENHSFVVLGKLNHTVNFLEESIGATELPVANFGFSKLNTLQIELILESIIGQLLVSGKTYQLNQALLILEQYLDRHYEYRQAVSSTQEKSNTIIPIQAIKLYLILGNGTILIGNPERGIEYLSKVIKKGYLIINRDARTNHEVTAIINQATWLLAKANSKIGVKKWSDSHWINTKLSYSFNLTKKD